MISLSIWGFAEVSKWVFLCSSKDDSGGSFQLSKVTAGLFQQHFSSVPESRFCKVYWLKNMPFHFHHLEKINAENWLSITKWSEWKLQNRHFTCQSASKHHVFCIKSVHYLHQVTAQLASNCTTKWRKSHCLSTSCYAVSPIVFYNQLIDNTLQTHSKLAYFRPQRFYFLARPFLRKHL